MRVVVDALAQHQQVGFRCQGINVEGFGARHPLASSINEVQAAKGQLAHQPGVNQHVDACRKAVGKGRRGCGGVGGSERAGAAARSHFSCAAGSRDSAAGGGASHTVRTEGQPDPFRAGFCTDRHPTCLGKLHAEAVALKRGVGESGRGAGGGGGSELGGRRLSDDRGGLADRHMAPVVG